MKTRAKFKCTNKKEIKDQKDEVEGFDYYFEAVYDDDPESENGKFFKYTPAGSISISIVNPNVDFEVYKEYFVDFLPCE